MTVTQKDVVTVSVGEIGMAVAFGGLVAVALSMRGRLSDRPMPNMSWLIIAAAVVSSACFYRTGQDIDQMKRTLKRHAATLTVTESSPVRGTITVRRAKDCKSIVIDQVEFHPGGADPTLPEVKQSDELYLRDARTGEIFNYLNLPC